jgi:hypothetical protein
MASSLQIAALPPLTPSVTKIGDSSRQGLSRLDFKDNELMPKSREDRPEGAQGGRVLFRQRRVDRKTDPSSAGRNRHLRHDADANAEPVPRCALAAV